MNFNNFKEYLTAKNIIIFSVPITIAILIIMLFNLTRTVDQLSLSLIESTANRTHKELSDFFEPINKNLHIAKDWSEFNFYNNLNYEELNPRFIPILKNNTQITSVIIANTEGEEYMLLETDTSWINRYVQVYDTVTSMDRVEFYMQNGKTIIHRKWNETSSYDPRQRPWFKGVFESKNENENSWTDPYMFFTKQEPGITISTSLRFANDNRDYVLALDVLLMDISLYTSKLKVSENGKAFIFTDDERLIGLPVDEKFSDINSIKENVLKKIDDLGIENISEAINYWNENGRKSDNAFMFKIKREHWWCGIKPFQLNSEKKFYIAVIVPESDFLANVNKTVVVIFAGFLLVLVLTIFVIKGYNQKRKAYQILEHKNKEIEDQKKEIEEQRNEIRDSINYSCRIQKAILPPSELIDKLLPNNFVLYKPKDVVSGDFYWIHEYNNDCIIFCAADCTGHGVPGAFMSIVGHNGLNRAVREYKHSRPDKILNALNNDIAETLRQNNSFTNVLKDGMDIALCSYHKSKLILEYAGAYNPLYVIRRSFSLVVNDKSIEPYISIDDISLFEIKATKKPIGNVGLDREFENHIINLQKDDLLIIFSDGFADQFGGKKGKKFMYKSFKKLLVSLYSKPMKEIETELENIFENWKGNKFQVDDVIVMGVKI